MSELNKILLSEGPDGVDAYCKKRIQENDRKWASMFFVACIMVIGFWCTNWKAANPDLETELAPEMSDEKIEEYKCDIYEHELYMDSIDNFYYGIKP